MLNAQWLETFTTLCETGHFTRAASRLAMTQPGVSQHLRKLEEQLGQKLITRDGKSFSLTPAGEAVLAMGRARRAEEQALRAAILRDDADVGAVAIACSGSFAMRLFPQLLPRMAAAPQLTLRLEAAPQERVLAGVADGAFDLGIVDHPPGHARLAAEHLGREELCLVLPAATEDRPVTFADLDARGFIAHPDGFAYADELFALNFPEAFKGADRLNVRAHVNQINQIPAPVAAGIGYTLLPRSGVEAYPGRDRLRIVTLPQPRHHDLWLIQRRGRVLPARVDAIAGQIRATAASLSGG
ncbi:LysR family transcriptional regulator [Aurantimonas coralicida]|uniref:LysR family transcriptional regulator n=1 Tax=Aurantimonas coralicida TaxID=182270 RepID=UPI001D196E89|nr:LysR family transcriptional regulator [Aurantimonas coralicida]MCC4297101.1 LysR family transcriptional regulator [Aurantimonas coralicida]